jgi:hypothetical protein
LKNEEHKLDLTKRRVDGEAVPAPLPPLTVADLQKEARAFAIAESQHAEPSLFGVTDGKAVGTYLENKFQTDLLNRYAYPRGSSAKGIDFPGLDVDIKVTSVRMPPPNFLDTG